MQIAVPLLRSEGVMQFLVKGVEFPINRVRFRVRLVNGRLLLRRGKVLVRARESRRRDGVNAGAQAVGL